ncbi:dipeptide ABC transporter ATP-binding protein [Microbacterium saperdae]|uniref:Peptide/nickel transport system ATP-binding protein n=1 Tax=Microbacterium saperdae TaxID=69368 RepID=A0A543BLV7_9MICO|nr:ABC transporter ATP-binding protein [Microbacterium saperdae]TQL85810.1 peptide/nickel transport system ATP-binding protein [Microbacterium saperdae]
MMTSMENSSAPAHGIVLDVHGLTVTLSSDGRRNRVVDGIDLTVHRGEVFALLGESGSGKSMTARAIMGLIDKGDVDAESMSLNGTDLLSLSAEQHRRLRGVQVSLVMQDALSALNPVLSIGDQIIDLIRAHRTVSRRAAEKRAVELLGLVGIPTPDKRVRDFPHQFSGGQRQRILIAMAIALEPDLIIADEPTTALDVTVQAQILDLLLSLRERLGMGILLITHDLGVVMEVADQVAVMRSGRIVEAGSADNVLTAPQHDYTKQLLHSMPRDVSAANGDVDAPPILEGRGLERTFRSGSGRRAHRVAAVAGVDLHLRSGEILAIVGESGSGKSTLARMLVGLDTPDAGTLSYRDQDVTRGRLRDRKILRRGVQMVFQDPYMSLNPRMTVQQIIAEPLAANRSGTPATRRERVAELLELVGLTPEMGSRFPHQFSGGQRQRIGIARALALHPDVLVCDEPVSALDVSIRAQIIDLLCDLRERLGMSIVFIAHDLSLVRHIADRVAVMYLGNMVEIGDTEEVYRHPSHPYTRSLLSAIPPQTRAERGMLQRRTALSA